MIFSNTDEVWLKNKLGPKKNLSYKTLNINNKNNVCINGYDASEPKELNNGKYIKTKILKSMKLKSQEDYKSHFGDLFLDYPVLNMIIDESFEEEKNREAAKEFIKRIMEITPLAEKNEMIDFLRSLLADKNSDFKCFQKISISNDFVRKKRTPITKTNKNKKDSPER